MKWVRRRYELGTRVAGLVVFPLVYLICAAVGTICYPFVSGYQGLVTASQKASAGLRNMFRSAASAAPVVTSKSSSAKRVAARTKPKTSSPGTPTMRLASSSMPAEGPSPSRIAAMRAGISSAIAPDGPTDPTVASA